MLIISWNRTTLPKEKGGLLLCSVSSLNATFKAKMAWRLMNSSSPLASWIKAKYGSYWKNNTSPSSNFWKALSLSFGKFRDKLCYKVGNGADFSLIYDPWCNGDSLWNKIGANCMVYFGSDNCKIKDIIREGAWSLPKAFASSYPDICREICSINISQRLDEVNWCDGFVPTTKIFKDLYFSRDLDVDWHKHIWFKGFSLKYAVFTWMAYIEGLKTSDHFARRNIGDQMLSPLCHNFLESHTHLFFTCSVSFWIIRNILLEGDSFVFEPNLSQVLEAAYAQKHKAITNLHLLITSVAIFVIWCERNARIFNNSSTSPSSLILNIKRRVAFKLRRWKFKEKWPTWVIYLLEVWRSDINGFIS